jgi:lipopolysaccharide/colanic/teichoic acid biosynthesis glycosyltransferase
MGLCLFLHLFHFFPTIKTQKTLKRGMDIAGALMGLILFSPLMAVVAALIKITSRGPVLFRQTRLGYEGRRFVFFKFRSMQNGCHDFVHREYVQKWILGKTDEINNGSGERPFYKITHDPRITPLGRFLRKTSLDELPQLWNVLKGEMSLVGPRPAIGYEIEAYKDWHVRRTMEVKPGITGLWQVMGRNRTTFDEMAQLDLQYAKNWSLLLDLKILLKTFKVIVEADGS